MKTTGKRILQNLGLSILLAGMAANANASPTDLATSPMVNGSSVLVRPNIFLMMDDSGSMAWDYMPDTTSDFSGRYGYTSAQCNGVYYDPTIAYTTPPLSIPISLSSGSTAAGSPTITFASSSQPTVGQVVSSPDIPVGAYIVALAGTTQATLNVNAAVTSSGGTFTIGNYPASSFTAAPIDGFRRTTTATINLATNFGPGQNTDTSPTTSGGGPAYYYNYTGSQTHEADKNYYSTSSTFYRECKSSLGSSPGNGVFTKVYVGTTSTLAISGTTSTSVTGITVNGKQIMKAASSSSTSPSTVASNIAAQINACASTASGNCTVAGYAAAADGNTLTIIAPLALGSGVQALLPVIAPTSGIMTITPSAFAYSGPGNKDETTNFANWYTYYRTRILMMKTASGETFNKLDSNYRVGFGTMNDNGFNSSGSIKPNIGNMFLNLATFDSTHKNDFLTMLYSSLPGSSTPLLDALSTAGLLYAHKETTINGVSVTDPMEYSCQQNYTILSTDGFWNDQTNSILDTTNGNVITSKTAVGNQDGTESTNSKQYDGSIQHYHQATGTLQFTTKQQKTTSTLQWSTNLQETGYQLATFTDLQATSGTLQMQTSQVQSQTSQLQTRTSQLQQSTSNNSGSNWSSWSNVSSCTWDTTNPTRTKCQYTSYSSWGGTSSCTTVAQNSGSSNGTTWNGPATQCQTVVTVPFANASSCTATATPDASGNTTQCQTTTSPWTNVLAGSCTSGGPTSGLTTACRLTGVSTSYVSSYPVPTCTLGTFSGGLGSSPYTGGSGTADASGKVIISCQTDGSPGPWARLSPAYVLGPNQTCTYSPLNAIPHQYCADYLVSSVTQSVATYPPVCHLSTGVASGGNLTATTDGNGLWVTGCGTGSYIPPQTVAANGSCTTTLPNVQCSITGSSTSYVTSDPPVCAVNYNNPGTSTAVGTSVVTACPVAATFNPTWTDVTSGSCTPSAVEDCRYTWGSTSSVASCTQNYSSGPGPWTVPTGTQCSVTTTGGTSNTLSDVAEFYYLHDLRTAAMGNCTSGATGNTLCTSATQDPYDNVPSSLGDSAPWQHMTTFTLGLGARGKMVFDPNYDKEPNSSGVTDYYDINHSAANPPTVCSWQSAGSGTCTWPVPPTAGGDETTIDDLWHAAVDGRGKYYSATNPTALSSGLTNALATVQERIGTAAAATTSDPNISQGNNFLFASTFLTMEWSGEFVREQMNLTNGQVIKTIDPLTGKEVPVNDWTAQAQLDSQLWSSRKIYTFDTTNANGNNLKLLTWTNLTAGEQALFNEPVVNGLSQLCTSPPAAWLAGHAYNVGDQYTASGSPYLVLIPYTSGGSFGTVDTNNSQPITSTVCLPIWTASTFYPVGAEYRVISGGNTTWYHVNTAYTSGPTSFGSTDTANATMLTGGTNANGAAGSNLLNFVRGDRSNEEGSTPDNTKYFRNRAHVLGDIVNSEGAYVAQSGIFNYADPGYSTFLQDTSARQGMVYVAANDGMLHAFYADSDLMNTTTGDMDPLGVAVSGGAEAWAYVPQMVQPNLYKLADKNYKNQHEYTVDGTPTIGDVCVSSCSNALAAVWKTILVAGLNGGGRGYYALDITNPVKPVALWEFTDTNMGYTYGNPVITKLSNGTWVVLVTSGYNNVSPGDGQGHLYVLDAYSGTLHTSVNGTGIIDTGVGSPSSPSGLARITAEVVDPASNNLTYQVYGGDLDGNLWRFDVNNNVGAPGYDAQLLATLLSPGGVAQPITVKPEVGLVGTSTVVYVGTGRYLGQSDILAADQVSPNTQTLYGIYDPLVTTSTPGVAIYANPRASTCSATLTTNCFVQQTLTPDTCPIGAPTTLCKLGQPILDAANPPIPANIPTPNAGWYEDLPYSGQRDNTDPALQRGTLDFTINLPTGAGAECTNGGSSYSISLDYKTGGAVNTSAVTYKDAFGNSHTIYIAGVFLGNALATRPIFVELPSGAVVALIRMGNGDTTVTDVPIGTGNTNTRRVSWRELMQ